MFAFKGRRGIPKIDAVSQHKSVVDAVLEKYRPQDDIEYAYFVVGVGVVWFEHVGLFDREKESTDHVDDPEGVFAGVHRELEADMHGVVFFEHGSGQAADNELLRRLQHGFGQDTIGNKNRGRNREALFVQDDFLLLVHKTVDENLKVVDRLVVTA